MPIKAYICCVLALCISTDVFAVKNFYQAKKELVKIYKQLPEPTSFYCNCPLTINKQNQFRVDLKSCGYEVRKQEKRAKRIEFEHIMPAYDFGHQLQCWQQGGRKNCTKDKRFNQMEGDLHNLVPAIGEVNGDRANYKFSAWKQEPYQYGSCDIIVDFKGKRVNPPKTRRGEISRAYLYMSDKYNIKLSNQQRQLFEIWNKTDLPDEFECLKNQLVTNIQGNDNKFITEKCK